MEKNYSIYAFTPEDCKYYIRKKLRADKNALKLFNSIFNFELNIDIFYNSLK